MVKNWHVPLNRWWPPLESTLAAESSRFKRILDQFSVNCIVATFNYNNKTGNKKQLRNFLSNGPNYY